MHLMSAYGSQVLRYCHRMLGDAEQARDVRQVVFVQAYEGLAGFEGRSSLRSWLFAIARHRCLDAIKSSRRRQRREAEHGEGPSVGEGSAGSASPTERWQVQQALLACLQALAPRVRSTVLLRCQDGLTFPELARMLGERPGTIQARVARATETLKRCLASRGIEP